MPSSHLDDDMDVVKAIETYVTKMVSTPPVMKVLLLDSHTVRIFLGYMHRKHNLATDTYRLLGLNPVNASVPSSLSDGPNRQPKKGPNAPHEMRLLSAKQ